MQSSVSEQGPGPAPSKWGLDRSPDPLGDLEVPVETGVDQDDGELVASVPGEGVDLRTQVREHPPSCRSACDPTRWPWLVVHQLEAVEVEEQDRQR